MKAAHFATFPPDMFESWSTSLTRLNLDKIKLPGKISRGPIYVQDDSMNSIRRLHETMVG